MDGYSSRGACRLGGCRFPRNSGNRPKSLEGAWSEPYGPPKRCFSAHLSVRISIKFPFGGLLESLFGQFLGTSVNRGNPPFTLGASSSRHAPSFARCCHSYSFSEYMIVPCSWITPSTSKAGAYSEERACGGYRCHFPALFTELSRRLIFSETSFIYSVHIERACEARQRLTPWP